MKLAKIALLLGILSITTAGFAANTLKSSNVTLPSGTIAPRESLSLSSSQLVTGAHYKVTCKITDANNKTDPSTMQVQNFSYDGLPVTIYLNGNQVNGNQFKLTQVNNVLEIVHVSTSYEATLSLVNLDQTNSITVSSCFAVAETDN